jgi:hypothetical protein
MAAAHIAAPGRAAMVPNDLSRQLTWGIKEKPAVRCGLKGFHSAAFARFAQGINN